MRICLDAGHGGKDPGAVNDIREADMNLIFVQMLQDKLKERHSIILTRSNNTFVSLMDRCKIANDSKANLFLSIHCNSSVNKNSHGIETLVYNDVNDELTRRIHNKLILNTGAKDRGIIVRPKLYVLKNTNMKAILIETGFISNKIEQEKIRSKEYKEIIVNSICEIL